MKSIIRKEQCAAQQAAQTKALQTVTASVSNELAFLFCVQKRRRLLVLIEDEGIYH